MGKIQVFRVEREQHGPWTWRDGELFFAGLLPCCPFPHEDGMDFDNLFDRRKRKFGFLYLEQLREFFAPTGWLLASRGFLIKSFLVDEEDLDLGDSGQVAFAIGVEAESVLSW